MSKCTAKHTAYQPKDDEWKCPHCGEDECCFYIDLSAPDSDYDCELIHAEDWIVCGKCDRGWSGATIAKKMQVKNNTVILEVVMSEKRQLSMEELVAVKNMLNAKGIKQK